ncbi:MAG TPA: hypothetical protein VGR92_15540 [Steroidobacteraceae bacterium]|nr:hypothetical protein [Steroidobacteraceae bacterium]
MKSPSVLCLATLCLLMFPLTHVAHAQTRTTSAENAVAPAPVTFTTGSLTAIWTKQDRLKDNLFYYPDMPIGVIRTQDRSRYLFFAPGTGLNQAAQPNGEYVSAGTLDRFAPAIEGPGGPLPSMKSGSLQPAPDGDYDRDYAGGGPIYVLGGPGYRLSGAIDRGAEETPLLILLYHGEYHPDAGKGLPFYGVSALALSRDRGRSFVKIGEIVSPHSTRDETTATGLSVTADGALVEADANGYPVADSSSADRRRTYIYCLFSDRMAPNSPSGFSLARVRKQDFIDAVLEGQAPVFRKYYRPSAAGAGSRSQFFTEPGVGGNSTFVVTQPRNYIATPQVRFSKALHKFVLVYPQNQNSVWIRFADNLFDWSAAQPLYVTSDPAAKVFYASAVGRGHDPSVLGTDFYVYFVTGQVFQFQNIWSGPNGTLVREEVTVGRKTLAAPGSDEDDEAEE